MEFTAQYKAAAQAFNKAVNADTQLIALQKKISMGTATYADAMKCADRIGTICSRIIKTNPVTAIATEDLRAYAEQYLTALMKDGQVFVNDVCKSVQTAINEADRIGIKAVEISTDSDRMANIVKRFEDAESVEDIQFLTENPVVDNIMRSAVTDNIEANADRLDDAGLTVYITRSTGGGCCDWCESMAGTYVYGQQPKDFFLAHRNCTCQWNTYNNKRNITSMRFRTDSTGKRTREF